MPQFSLSLLFNSLLLATLLAASHALLKWTAIRPVEGYLELVVRYWPQIGLALAIYGFIFFYYIGVLRRLDLAPLYASYTGLSILLILLVGPLLFGETVTPRQIAGTVLTVAGIVLIAWR